MTKEELEQKYGCKLFPVTHYTGCNGVAFYITKKLKWEDDLTGSIVVMPNGTHPIDMVDEITCGSCGTPIGVGDLTQG